MFATGTFGGTDTLVDVFGVLNDFVTDDGWTVHASSGTGLHASSGDCHVTLASDTTITMNDINGPAASSTAPDHCIKGKLAANTTIATLTGNQVVFSNDWTPPYANYWIFSGGMGDPKYVHLVVQKANGRFCHLSFGNLDKKGAVYDGGAFLFGVFWRWGFDAFGPSGFSTSADGSDISSGNHLFFGHANESFDFCGHNLFLGDLDNDAIIGNCGNVTPTNGKMTPLTYRASNGLNLAAQFADSTRWLGHIFFLGPNPLNGFTPLFEVPVMRYDAVNLRSYYLGSVPGFRYCSMIGRNEAEEVSFTTDDFMVFPIKRALAWNPEPYADKLVTSGPYGIALKKNE